jgi:hypothetical protein
VVAVSLKNATFLNVIVIPVLYVVVQTLRGVTHRTHSLEEGTSNA